MKVKICGIKTVEEAKRICDLQPDAIGILVGFEQYMAPNRVEKERAREIVDAVPSSIDTFLLTDRSDAETNISYSRFIGNNYLQLTADIMPDEIYEIKLRLPNMRNVKVVHVRGEESIGSAGPYEACDSVDELLLDSKAGYKRGGTGIIHDWDVSRRIVERSKKPVWLAGGLKVGNLRDAIATVRPYGVDVETGVQNPDGSKNYGLAREFISIARLF